MDKKWPNKRLTQEEAEQKIKDLTNGEYELISEYQGSVGPCTFRHKTCGKEFTVQRYNNFVLRNQRCPDCKVVLPRKDLSKVEKFIEEIDKVPELKGQYEYISGYVNGSTKCKIKHKSCGTIFETQPKGFLTGWAGRCPVCSKEKQTQHMRDYNKTYLEDTLNEAPDGKEYQWLETYKGRNCLNHKIKHLTCGTTFEVHPADFRNLFVRCPICSHVNSSSTEIIIYDSLSSLTEIRRWDTSILKGLESDMVFENEKIIIEVNGMYWHSTRFKDKLYHCRKTLLAKSKGYRMIHFFEGYDLENFINFMKAELGKPSGNLIKLGNILEDSKESIVSLAIYNDRIDIEGIQYRNIEERKSLIQKVIDENPDIKTFSIDLSLDLFPLEENFLTELGFVAEDWDSPKLIFSDGHEISDEETERYNLNIWTNGTATFALRRKK